MTSERQPCGVCHGHHHTPTEVLRFVPKLRQWLCAMCRREEEVNNGSP